MARSDRQNAEVTPWDFRGQAFSAPALSAWNTPSDKPAARCKGHHAARRPERPGGENSPLEGQPCEQHSQGLPAQPCHR